MKCTGKMWALVLGFVFVSLSQVECILSKNQSVGKTTPSSSTTTGKPSDNIKKQDNLALPTLDRDYGYSETNHIGGYGTSGWASGGGYDGYGGYDGGKYHGYEEHKHQDYGHHKALAIKGLLVPLAGVALLGAAAAFVSNPILLQLGVISGTYGRKRRDTNNNRGLEMEESAMRLEAQEKLSEIQLLERFMAQIPKEEMQSQEKKLLANYLSCSGMTSSNYCLERLTCELHSAEGENMPVETNVMAIVTNEILSNDYIPESTKISISRAMQRGRKNEDCSVYKCEDLESMLRRQENLEQK